METYTEEYFKEEVRRYFEMCGDKKFWALPEEQRKKAFDGIGHIYLFLDENADIESCVSLLDATSANYEYRKKYLDYC
jgi:hypothetical protein